MASDIAEANPDATCGGRPDPPVPPDAAPDPPSDPAVAPRLAVSRAWMTAAIAALPRTAPTWRVVL